MFSYTQKITATQTPPTIQSFNKDRRYKSTKLAPEQYNIYSTTTTTTTTTTMSPSAFKQQVTQLLSEFNHCLELCNAVLANRRLGSTHQAMDNLQTGLTLSTQSISTEFNTLRKLIGSRMDLGDDTARNSLNRAIREVQSDIQSRLTDIAYPKVDHERREQKAPGFRELLKKLERIEYDVSLNLESLGQRLQAAKAPKPSTPAPKKEEKLRPKSEEVTVSLKELDHLMQHMKNSWVEKKVEGKSLFVNVFDDKKVSWERPEGFVKFLPAPKKVVRTPTWEQEEQQKRAHIPRTATRGARPTSYVREDIWDNTRGW